jgi:hypothetical protein
MNWKNITLEQGFIKQELDVNGTKAVNYIPLDQVDSFGVVSSENKRWLYAGIFFGLCTLLMAFSQNISSAIVPGMISAGLICVYFLTRKTWFNITSSQTKFSVQMMTSNEEIQAVNTFVLQIKQSIHSSQNDHSVKAA